MRPGFVLSPLTPTETRARRIRNLADLGRKERIAGSVRVREDGKLHHHLTSESRISRADRVTITRWQLGIVARHQRCHNCQAELSRLHAITCAGVDDELGDMAQGIAPHEWFGDTDLDMVINGSVEGFGPGRVACLVNVISTIELRCKGRERTENGFFQAVVE